MWVCDNCEPVLRIDKIPPLSKLGANQRFTDPRRSLQGLFELELASLALRLPFYKMVHLPSGRQKSIQGPIHNVPADVVGSIASFPSTLDKGQIIPLAIKRREEYKTTHGRPQNVRVDLIVAAAKNLTGNDEEGNAATFYTALVRFLELPQPVRTPP